MQTISLQYWSYALLDRFSITVVELDRTYEENFFDECFMQDIAPFKFAEKPNDKGCSHERVTADPMLD